MNVVGLQKLITAGFILLTASSFGQYFSNPSFEGTPQMSVSPSGWYSCNQNSTPDTQPVTTGWNFTLPASDGNTYLGLVMRGFNDSFNDYQTEAAGTRLIQPLRSGVCYSLTIDIAFFPGAEFNTGFDLIRYNNPGYLLVWGARSDCGKDKLLWKSPLISNSTWQPFTFMINPDVNYTNIIFEADYADRSHKVYGNILLDNIRLNTGKLDLGADKVICEGETLTLGSADITGTYLWSTGSVQPQIEVTKKGTYWLQKFSNGCVLRDTIQVSQIDSFTLELGKDVSLCAGDTHELNVAVPRGTYQWNTGSSNPRIVVSEPGRYEVTVDNGCESHSDAITISIRDECCNLSAPNVFTPNADAVNDQFEIATDANITAYSLRIFNRWGQQVFQSDAINQFWDGNSGSGELPAGVYFWITNIRCLHKRQVENKTVKGEVTLIR